MNPPDVLVIGRAGVDIYPNQVGLSLREVTSFGKYLGGSAANVAVAAARHGRRTALVSRTGEDPFGEFVRSALAGYGVDVSCVTTVPGGQTPVTFCEMFPPDDFPLYFYRRPDSPDLRIAPDEVPLSAVAAAGVLWVTLSGLSAEPSRTATMRALEHRARKGITILDLDYRPSFWGSAAEARERARDALARVTVAVGNRDEFDNAVGTRDEAAAASAVHELGVGTVVVKKGPDGVFASRGAEQVHVGPVPITVVNGLGAGDAFGGALCHALLSQWPLEQCMLFGNAAGAIVASQIACSDAMPTSAEVDALLTATAGSRR